MPPVPPDENQDHGDVPPAASPAHPRIRTRTPEQRRFLNTPRPVPPNESRKEPEPEPPEPPPDLPKPEPRPAVTRKREPAPPAPPERKESSTRAGDLLVQTQAARVIEMRQAFLIISALVILAGIFFAGLKFNSIKYRLMSRINGPDLEESTNKFPGLSSDELIETGLAAERRGEWQEAADRFVEAKRQNRALPGVLFRIGKSAFDRGELDNADIALDHAIKFGENLSVANYYRGLIAVRRHELAAATRFFEAAASAEPFISEFYYYWGEALRLDQHPRDAIRRYQQAIQRTPSTQDATLCQFKIRLARIEAAEGAKVNEEVAAKREAGPLSVDWLMTDAALQLQAGKMDDAVRLVSEARDKGVNGLFMTCAGDVIFRQAAEKNPALAPLIDVAPAKPFSP